MGGAAAAYSFVACLRHLTSDHASLVRRNTVPTPDRGTSNIRRGGGVGVLDRRYVFELMHGRSRMTIDPRILTMPERSMSGGGGGAQ